MKKTISDTDSIYSIKPTSSHQNWVFLGNADKNDLRQLGVTNENGVLRLQLNYANLFRNAVEHLASAQSFHSRNHGVWNLDRSWIGSLLEALDNAFKGENETVFLANISIHTGKRVYLTNPEALARETDLATTFNLRQFLFSGDIISVELINQNLTSLIICVGESQISLHPESIGQKIQVPYTGPFDPSALPLQLISYGAPGTGKSYQTDKIVKEIPDTIRVTFHPDSDYASFVGCYKPAMEKRPRTTFSVSGTGFKVEKGPASPADEDFITYRFVPQAFTKAYELAWRKMAEWMKNGGDLKRQYLVIEEINRGNCAQIFGDLFQLLDRDDNGYSKYPVDPDADLAKHLHDWFRNKSTDKKGDEHPAVVSGSDGDKWKSRKAGTDETNTTWDDVLSGRKLVLPPNLYIWATMNTSDQSLFPMDSAFKRRWEWEYVPIADAKKGWAIVADGKRFDWWTFLEKANEAVRKTTGSEDKELGYFFVKPPEGSTEIPAKTFVDKVLFYLFGDAFKDDTPPESLFPKKKTDEKSWMLRDFRTYVLVDGGAKSEPNEKNLAAWLEQIEVKPPDGTDSSSGGNATAADEGAAAAVGTPAGETTPAADADGSGSEQA